MPENNSEENLIGGAGIPPQAPPAAPEAAPAQAQHLDARTPAPAPQARVQTPEQVASLLSGMGSVCPQCHLPVAPDAYFCPNCGKELRSKPLSTSFLMQAWIYAFSIVLPMLAFLALSYWPAIKYLRSPDEKAKQIGIVAMILMILSTIITFWLTIVWLQNYIQQSVNAVGNIGNLGGF